MWETWVRSLGREDPLEKEMVTHSSTLAWKIPWTEEHGGLQSTELQRVGHDFTFTFTFVLVITYNGKEPIMEKEPELLCNNLEVTWFCKSTVLQ